MSLNSRENARDRQLARLEAAAAAQRQQDWQHVDDDQLQQLIGDHAPRVAHDLEQAVQEAGGFWARRSAKSRRSFFNAARRDAAGSRSNSLKFAEDWLGLSADRIS